MLVERLSLKDAGLRAIAEIVHDIDLKDGKYVAEDRRAALDAGEVVLLRGADAGDYVGDARGLVATDL